MSGDFNPQGGPAPVQPQQPAQPQQPQQLQSTDLGPLGGSAVAPTPPRQIDQNVYTTGFADNSVKQYDFELYEGKLNTTDRLYLLRPNEIIKARRHYDDTVKFVYCNSEYRLQGTAENQQEVLAREAACCKVLKPAFLTFAALVIKYVTQRDGTVIMPFQTPELRLWRFGTDKYMQLKEINKNFPLHTVDISVLTTDEKYRKMNIGALPPDRCIYLHPRFPADLKQQFEEWATLSLPKIPRDLGRRMSDEDILKAKGSAPAAPATMQAGDQPIMSFDSLVGNASKT